MRRLEWARFFDWVTADAHYGDDGELLDALEGDCQQYLLEGRAEKAFWTADPATVGLKALGHGRPPSPAARDRVQSAKATVPTTYPQ